VQRIVPSLLGWFELCKRDLPWRSDPLPYYVWVSEIMLQQTRVEAVKPYFARFIEALPDTAALASCPEDRLLKLWEGLGYYNRARNMKRAAVIVMEKYGGNLPADTGRLLELPGIGSYTAGAIASIAYGLPAAAVDGNVLRVLSRLCGDSACIDDPGVKRFWEQQLGRMLCSEGPEKVPPSVFNQALMELGALVCVPGGAPRCSECPISSRCSALALGNWDSLPVRKVKKPRRTEDRTVLVIRDATDTVICRRPSKGLLAGLWELPNFDGHLDEKEVVAQCRMIGAEPVRVMPLDSAKHVFTHVEWHMTGWLVLAADLSGLRNMIRAGGQSRYLVISPDKTEKEYPIPSAFVRYTAYLNIRLGQEKYE